MTLRICKECGKEEEVQSFNPIPKCRKCSNREEASYRSTKKDIRNKRSKTNEIIRELRDKTNFDEDYVKEKMEGNNGNDTRR